MCRAPAKEMETPAPVVSKEETLENSQLTELLHFVDNININHNLIDNYIIHNLPTMTIIDEYNVPLTSNDDAFYQ